MAEALEIEFGYLGNSLAYQGIGWSWRENGGVWMLDDESTLIVPRPEQRGDYLLELDLETLIAPGRHNFQRLGISVNGVNLSNQVLRSNAETHCWVPWAVLSGPLKSVVILTHPDGWQPAELSGGEGDQRVMSFHARSVRLSLLTESCWEIDYLRLEKDAQLQAIIKQQQNRDELATHSLLLNFESLGSNCEFGMMQRHHGAEPLGLFRFSYTPLDGLLAALEGDFHTAGFRDSASLVLNAETREYELVDEQYGFEWHTWQYEGQTNATTLERQELVRLPYLVHHFYETLEDGDKIFVVRDESGPTSQAKIERLLAALSRHGTVTLLWVSIVTDGHATGDVEYLSKRLMRGWIDRLTTRSGAINASMPAWRIICQRAYQMWVADQAPEAVMDLRSVERPV